MKSKLSSPVGLNPGGIGPRIFKYSSPFVILAIVLGIFVPEFCSFHIQSIKILKLAGWIMLALGIVAYVATLIQFIGQFSKGKLVTTGIFSLSRNPLYASWILLILPSIALIADNWFFLFPAIAMYFFFAANIKEEEENLQRIFGEEYIAYKKRVNRLVFIPKFLTI